MRTDRPAPGQGVAEHFFKIVDRSERLDCASDFKNPVSEFAHGRFVFGGEDFGDGKGPEPLLKVEGVEQAKKVDRQIDDRFLKFQACRGPIRGQFKPAAQSREQLKAAAAHAFAAAHQNRNATRTGPVNRVGA